MKKSVVLTLLLVLSIIFTACAAPPPPGQQPTATSAAPQPKATCPPPPPTAACPACPTPKPAATCPAPQPTSAPAKKQTAADVYAWVDGKPNIPDPPKDYPPGELGRMVKLGEDIIYHTHTHPLTKDLVGDNLDCTSCHIDGGKAKTLGTFIGTAAAFPAYSKREKTVQTLQDRINNCFMRSMNGTRPIIDTEASVAMAAYVTWLSEGLPIQMNPKKPINPFYTKVWINKKLVPLAKKATHENYLNGQKLYQQKCAVCHGEDGQGKVQDGKILYPPIWGDKSFNTGAGLAHPTKMATWLQFNMPPGGPKLSDQEAVDIAIYVDAQPHPDFDLKEHLLPREKMGYYNSKVLEETHSVAKNFKALGLDVNKIRGSGAPAATEAKPTATPAASAFDPAAYFKANCAACHGANAEGQGSFPALDKAATEHDTYVETILNGKGAMPSFKGKLTEEQVNKIVDWLAKK